MRVLPAGYLAILGMLASVGGGPVQAAEIKASFGVGTRPQYEGADELETIPAFGMKASIEERYLLIEGLTGRLNLINSLGVNAGPLFSWREGRAAVDDPAVAAMRDIDGTFEAGLFASLSLPTGRFPGDWVTFEVEGLHDTGGVHNGATAAFGVTLGKKVGVDNYAMLTLSATHATNGFADTYFGIDAADSAASGLPVHDPGGGLKNVDVVATLYYALGEAWTFGTEATWSVLQGDFADSPIVDRGSEDQYRLIVTLTRKF